MFGILKSFGDLATNVVDTALAPVEMALDLGVAVSQPFADAAKELTKDVKSLTK